MSLRRLLKRGSTTEVLNNGMDSSLIETKIAGGKYKGGGGRRGADYDRYIHPGRERFGVAFEVFGDSVRMSRVA